MGQLQQTRSFLRFWILVVSIGGAGIIYDPSARAADPKRVFFLLFGIVVLAFSCRKRWLLKARRTAAFPRSSSPKSPQKDHQIEALALTGEKEHTFSGGSRSTTFWILYTSFAGISQCWGNRALGFGDFAAWCGAGVLMIFLGQFPRTLAIVLVRACATLIGAGSGLFAIIQIAMGAKGIEIHGGHGNPNWLGMVIAVSMPLTFDCARFLTRQRRWVASAMVIGAIAVEAIGILASVSRVAWVACILVAGMAVLRQVKRLRIEPGPAKVATLIAVGILLASLLGALFVFTAYKGNLSDSEVGHAMGGRLQIWRTALKAVPQHMIFGSGLGSFESSFAVFQGNELQKISAPEAARRYINAQTAHNDWLEAMLETGLIGLGLLFFAFFVGVADLLKKWPAGAFALLTIAICMCGDSPLKQPAILILWGLVAGVPARQHKMMVSVHAYHRQRQSASITSLPTAVRCSFTICKLRSGPRRRLVLAAFARCLLPRTYGRERLQMMLRWVKVSRLAHLGILLGMAFLLAYATKSWLATRLYIQARGEIFEKRIILLERAARLDSHSGEISLELGLAYLESATPHKALKELARSQTLMVNLGTYIALANASLALRDPQTAVHQLKSALRLHPGYFRAHANLCEAYRQLGHLKQAARHLRIAKTLYPGHPKLVFFEERLKQAEANAVRFRD